jgi:hypothetical protein
MQPEPVPANYSWRSGAESRRTKLQKLIAAAVHYFAVRNIRDMLEFAINSMGMQLI